MGKADSRIPGRIEASDQVTASGIRRLRRCLLSGWQGLRKLLLRLADWAAIQVRLGGCRTCLPVSRSCPSFRTRGPTPWQRLERTQNSGM